MQQDKTQNDEWDIILSKQAQISSNQKDEEKIKKQKQSKQQQ